MIAYKVTRKVAPTLANLLAGKFKLEGHNEPGSDEMSKAEIRSWIAAAAPDDPDDDTDTAAEAQSGDGDSRTDWASLMSITRRSLLTSQTKVRIHFLNERLLPLASRGGNTVTSS